MEDVLAVYERPYDADYPVICIDEGSKELESCPFPPTPPSPGREAKVDYSYNRHGLANIFLHFEPLVGRFTVTITRRKTALDWAEDMQRLASEYPAAKKICVVLDNLSTHTKAAFYKALPPGEARQLAERFEFHYTPKHGSWLNMAEIGLSILSKECLGRRLESIEALADQCLSWQQRKNAVPKSIDWRFTTADARCKMKRLYPVLECQKEAVAR